jgi:hypothetical protein
MKTNIIKGIDRIGIVLGIIAGIFMGIGSYPVYNDGLKEDSPQHTEWRKELNETWEKLKLDCKKKHSSSPLYPTAEELLREYSLLVETFKDSINDDQKLILSLLNIDEKKYWSLAS